MAQRLTAGSTALLLACGVSSAGQAALAQALADPMRPPQILAAEYPLASGQAPASRLQSVLISPARRLAVIDGRVVAIGGQVGGATVVAISETEVVLKKGDERETLKFHPGAQAGVQVRPVPRLQPPKVTR
jgi:MSHA biogenesis protein MshK